ncbi:FtsX-like permease family protein [Kribbella sp. VKM Ac-2569]|uniref:FtsX-like permease family protein n=1 Tax=Kribbella sp. VKM Ac-2569 TaxID=2512220 RepID=UPI00102C218B|nr:FtsX-like permease family protein [Kribbella sp. VKM Ac-2569]RZT17268.1 FtsX-like permease family protein [Kribbella sp. VKM Ac-2569]
MNPMTELGLRFVRRPGPGGRAANLAAFGATAVVALLVTFLIAGSLGLSQRSERIGWRSADKADPATAIGSLNLDDDQRVDGHRLSVLDLAILRPNELEPPPGLDHTPKPGEVFVSPEVAKRWSSLSKQYGVDKPTGVISDKGLSSPEEFIIIRGVQTIPADQHPQYVSSWNEKVWDSRMLGLLIAVASGIILVLFPILSLVGQAAGVAAKRREHRLAALRLAGATRTQVLWLSAVEQAVLAAAGAVVGLVGYTVLSPLIAQIPLGGGRWYVGDITVQWWTVLVVLVAVPVLSVISALIGLGRVSITPLGVVRGQTRKGLSVLRIGLLVIGPVMLAYYGMKAALLPLLIAVGFAALAVRVVGPWAVQLVGKTMAKAANGPVTLLAGRRLVDDPKGAFRPVAALVLSGFVTGFISVFMPSGDDDPSFNDMRIGVALLLSLVFLTVAASTAAGAVGTALDQAAPARALRRSGVPLSVIERAARVAAVVPVVAVGLPVVGFGALCGLALSGGKVITQGSSGVLLLLGQVVAGLVLVTVAGAAGAPVLRKASAN